MKTYEPNFKRLDELTAEGYLRKVISPCGRLMLYNYTDKTTYEGKWNKHTLNSRGTVYEIATGKVVARAFPKFFNFSELQPVKQKTILKYKSFQTFEKMDGSLGIVYYYDGEWKVNTRGSFTSDQAIKGKQILESDAVKSEYLSHKMTHLVEIIYPDNKIIVDYGTEQKLSLLATISTETGKEPDDYFKNDDALRVGFHQGYSYGFKSIEELQEHLATLDHTEEGYVVRLEDGTRVKFKSRAYLDVARLKSNMTPLAFWKTMKMGKVNVDFVEQLPEEFRDECDRLTELIEDRYAAVRDVLLMKFDGHGFSKRSRKEIGIASKRLGLNSAAMFAILDKKDDVLDKIVMKQIRPFGNKMEI